MQNMKITRKVHASVLGILLDGCMFYTADVKFIFSWAHCNIPDSVHQLLLFIFYSGRVAERPKISLKNAGCVCASLWVDGRAILVCLPWYRHISTVRRYDDSLRLPSSGSDLSRKSLDTSSPWQQTVVECHRWPPLAHHGMMSYTIFSQWYAHLRFVAHHPMSILSISNLV